MREPPSTSDDPDDPLAPPPPPPGPPHRRGRRWAAVLGWVVGSVLVVVVLAGFFVHVPYVIISPGFARPLDDSVIHIEGAPTYGNAGNLLYLTVTVTNQDPNLWKYLLAKLDSDNDVEPRTSVVGCLSDADNNVYNANLMSQSQDDATKVALERTGYTVTVTARRLLVTEVCPGQPAFGALRVGDQITAIGGTPVTDGASVTAAMEPVHPGDTVAVDVVRDGAARTVDAPTGQIVRTGGDGSGAGSGATSVERCVEPGATLAKGATATGDPCFGISIQAFVSYQFPIDVHFDLTRVGGPSAGLAFALAVVDDLTPGDLTGGQRVAITGAIAPDGSVQPIGGVEQKAITARQQGVDLMIVPRAEVAAARRGAGDMPVVGVDSLDDALTALQQHGGAPVPPPTTTAARS